LIAEVRSEVFGPGAVRFRPGCALPLGVTLTRARPQQSETAGLPASSQQTGTAGLSVSSQRAVLAMVLEVDGEGRMRMRRQDLPNRDATESVLALAEVPDRAGPYLDPESVMQALLASAAFPLAFGRGPCASVLLPATTRSRPRAQPARGPIPPTTAPASAARRTR